MSNKLNKTIVVMSEDKYAHSRYTKTLKKDRRFMAHDNLNEYLIGDKVVIEETKPLSKKKHWKVVQKL